MKEATVSEEGKKERTCEICGKKETESIPRKEAETIDTKALEAYGRRYAYETYGYDGNPNCNPSTGAGYFPAITKYIYTMEDGYKYARGAVTAQYNNDMGMGYPITAEIDGTLRRRKINLYIEETEIPNKYLIWVYYGGYADPYCN